MSVIKLSWSSMQAFIACARRYEFNNVVGIQKIRSADSRAMFLGSAVHAGIQAALEWVFHHRDEDWLTEEMMMSAGREGTANYILANTVVNKQRYDYGLRAKLIDSEYYTMVDDVKLVAKKMINYYLPRLQIGTRYVPASLEELNIGTNLEPAIEHYFEYEVVPGKVLLTGYIDAIMRDVVDGGYILMDWKARARFVDPALAMMDNQLQTYAAVINELSPLHPIKRVHMVQLKTQTPKPAVMTAGGKPSMVAQMTTWDEWCRTLPEGWKSEQFEEQMRDKVHPDSDFLGIVESPVSAESAHEALDQVTKVARMVQYAELRDNYPATYSAHTCMYCDFKRLCQIHQHGGDFSTVMQNEFENRVLTEVDDLVYDE